MNEVVKASAVLIAGPTASGKSALALALAERFGGIVVNADSMQVYRDLRVITARPTPEDERQVPHRLSGHVDAATNYSAGQFIRDAAAVIDEAARLGTLPIFVGGTGLYFKALTRGLSAVPPVPDEIRQAVRARMETEGPNALHDELVARDPRIAERLMRNDRARIARALEVLDATGRSLAVWHDQGMPPLLDADRAIKVFLAPNRSELYQRIDARFDAMVEAGALDEVRALDARRLDPLLPAMKAHGVPGLRRFLHGQMSLADAIGQGKRDTRHYAKRQFTWFRHQLPDWQQVMPALALDVLARAVDR